VINYPFWVNDFDRVKNYKNQYPAVSEIFRHPVSFWYGERRGKPVEKVRLGVQRLLHRASPGLPVLVSYNMPNRDMGHHSRGGAKNDQIYLEFLQDFAQGIGDRSPILIYEPDSLAHATQMSDADAEWRLNLMRTGLQTLTDNCAALIYVDIGHSNWLSAESAGHLLDQVSNPHVRGFSVNVSNYRSTTESMHWATRVCEYRQNDHFVIDTSRNGAGPYGNTWCNPPGRALGETPTTHTGSDLCDAFLWVKIPGESDGKCNGGPKAGKFWPQYAEQLVINSHHWDQNRQ
jgi:endoglucanase